MKWKTSKSSFFRFSLGFLLPCIVVNTMEGKIVGGEDTHILYNGLCSVSVCELGTSAIAVIATDSVVDTNLVEFSLVPRLFS